MFSPIVATMEANSSLTVLEESFAHASARNASTSSAADPLICSTTSPTKSWNLSFLATKSVSLLTSTIDAFFPSALMKVLTIPSAAIRPAFFSALARPFSRSHSTALSISPSVFVRAFLQSIIPAPVFSLSSFTIDAEIAIFKFLPFLRF